MICREKLQSRSRSIKALDYAMSGTAGTTCCEAFVEALGLKTLFSALMGKVRFPLAIPADTEYGT
jgi:beta-catenin-like protein 1